MLAEQDYEVAGAPVAQQREEVLQVGIQLLAAAEREPQDRREAQDRPDEARHARERPAELLARDRAAVDADDVGVDPGQDEEGQQQLREPTRIQHVLDQEPEPLVLVRVFPVRAVVQRAGNHAAREHPDRCGDCDPERRHQEDLDARHVRRVVHVVVARHRAPARRAAVDDREQGEDGA